MNRLRLCLIFCVITLFCNACKTTSEGTVNVVVNKGAIEAVKKPSDGFYTTASFWRSNYEVNLRTFTEESKDVKVQSKDNTPIHLGTLMMTAHTDPNPDAIIEYVKKFGFEEQERHDRRNKILETQLQTEARKAFSQYDAYQVYANQEIIQQNLFERMKKIGQEELFLIVESVQFGNWGFEDPQVEKAASTVVANRKAKEAEDAALAAAIVRKQRQEIEGQIFANNPALFKLKALEFQLWIEQARSQAVSQHQGPLTLIYGQSPTALQISAQEKQ